MLSQNMITAVSGRLVSWALRATIGLQSRLRRLTLPYAAQPIAPTQLNIGGLQQPHPLLAEALRDPSNLELDWLWLASNLSDEHERRYCLLRALAINPASETALRALNAISAR